MTSQCREKRFRTIWQYFVASGHWEAFCCFVFLKPEKLFCCYRIWLWGGGMFFFFCGLVCSCECSWRWGSSLSLLLKQCYPEMWLVTWLLPSASSLPGTLSGIWSICSGTSVLEGLGGGVTRTIQWMVGAAVHNWLIFTSCPAVAVNTTLPLTQQGHEQQLGYFTLLTFTDDLMTTYSKDPWE